MSEKKPNEAMSFSRFADWCRHIDSLSEEARHTVKVLLKKAGTDDAQAAEQILSSMTELDLRSNKISDISSLASLTNLTTLNLYNNQISDFSFLGSLTNLTTLNLESTGISDISSLGSLTNLTTLNLYHNQISDISSLGSLTNLTTLNLYHNQISDFSFLGSLTNLTTLNLSLNQISDFSFLGSLTNLTTLRLYGNEITDISFLGSLTNLTTLHIWDTQISDISFLGSLTNLTTLDLYDNQISDISSLGSLTNLITLNLQSNQISDISSLGSLTNLTTLDLSYNQISDISSLGSLTNLTTLDLNYNQSTDISSLGSLTNLTELDLKNNQITDISALRSLTNLTTLDFKNNQITDISFLGSLTNLTALNLENNQVTDISFLGSLTNLTALNLENNQITDISALRSLTNLTTLELWYNQITALCVLGELAEKRLTLSTKPIDAQKATEAIKVAYAAIGLEQPEVIICSSPRDAYIQLFNLPKRDHSPNCSDEWDSNRLGKKLEWEWISPSIIVREFTSPGVWESDLAHMTIESEADSTIRGLMYELVGSYARSEKTKGNVFPDYLFGLQSPETPTTLVKKIYLTEWYISSLGVNLSQKAQEILRSQKLLFEHCGFIFPFEKICFACDRPRHLRFDSQNRLHAEGEPAIEFADGWNFYYYHGVRLPEQYGQFHPNKWQSQWILAEENAEVRRVLIQGIGYDRIIQELSAKQIDSWQEYALLQIDDADDIDDAYDVEPICLLKMTCPSTGFIHALRVPPDLTSAREAIRWVNWDIDPEEFSVQT
ncbi:leucine-rich repeat domain-containing protein [Microcoleus sp. B4-C5]|uniref:leucine-rich repeat domain-containing protein n=1 Tax=unclassified Microcoleus TaxID=2642155 RepID=UPI002FD0B6C2